MTDKFLVPVELPANPTNPLEAAPKQYVDHSPRVVQWQATDPAGAALTTGDGKAYFRTPVAFNGLKLSAITATVTTASTSGIPTFQIANVTQGWDMLSTKVTIDANETDSSTAATPAVIDTSSSHDTLTSADLLRLDCDVAGTGTKGVIISMTFT